jgi:hypothetical protein
MSHECAATWVKEAHDTRMFSFLQYPEPACTEQDVTPNFCEAMNIIPGALFSLKHFHQLIKSPCFDLSIRGELTNQIGKKSRQLRAGRIR